MVLECNKRKVGGWYEKMAANYLKNNGLQIKVMNYRCRLGEIDLIARDGDELVFVEVKYRSSGANGDAIESVGYGKRKTISRVAKFYLMTQYHTVDLFGELSEMIRVRMDKKNLEFCMDIDSGLPSVLLGDEKRLKQIFCT